MRSVASLEASGGVPVATPSLPAGAATEATLAAVKAKTDNLDVLLSTRFKPGDAADISDRVGRLLGVIASISSSVAVTVADGVNATHGAKADAAWDGAAASPTSQSVWKYIGQKIEAVRALLAATLTVTGPLTDTQLRASAVPVYTKPATPTVAGAKVTAPAAAAVIADSGAMAAGSYLVEITMGFADALAAGKALSCEHRNAANGATLFEFGLCPAGTNFVQVYQRVVLALNERIRVVNLAVAGAAGSVASATIRLHLL